MTANEMSPAEYRAQYLYFFIIAFTALIIPE